MLDKWKKTKDETIFFHNVGSMDIHLTREQECAKAFYFYAGFRSIVRKWNIVNDSRYPVIFRQHTISDDADKDSQKYLLEHLDLSQNRGEVRIEIYNHSLDINNPIKLFTINAQKEERNMDDEKRNYDTVSMIFWDQEEDYIIDKSLKLKDDIEFKKSKILISSDADEFTQISICGKIIDKLYIKNESLFSIPVYDGNDNHLIFLLSPNDLLCFRSVVQDDMHFMTTFSLDDSVIMGRSNSNDSYNGPMATPCPSLNSAYSRSETEDSHHGSEIGSLKKKSEDEVSMRSEYERDDSFGRNNTANDREIVGEQHEAAE
jgi:hypothetical protein